MIFLTFFWLAPLLPLAVFVVVALGLSRFGRLSAGLALASMGASLFLVSSGLFASLHGVHLQVSFPWLSVGGRQFTFALWNDALGSAMALVVCIVGLVVFVYATSYMADDPHRGRFFAELSLFVGSMLALVLAADLLTLFIAWELVGLCSYLLIGFWFERPDVPKAATKAFLTTRLTDLALLAGVLLLVRQTGDARIEHILSSHTIHRLVGEMLPAITLLLFLGAAGKSAQIPFQSWLPDAMAGPTPVSALLHSATMVASGVFLVARLYPLFLATPEVLSLVAWIGVLTSLLGGVAALVESDLKRTLAYSTISQIGLMFVGLGSGSLLAGMLLLIAQAFFKATLFLSAGVLDHAVHGTTFEHMGGLLRRMPWTALAFGLSAVALAGLPVTFALPAKDAVLAAAWQTNFPLFLAALLASVVTALYSARIFGLVFLGSPTKEVQQAQEGRPGLLVPTLVIAALIPLALLANAAFLGHPLTYILHSPAPEIPLVTGLVLGCAVLGVIVGLAARRNWPTTSVWPPLLPVQRLFQSEFGLKPLSGWIAQGSIVLTRVIGREDTTIFTVLNRGFVALLLAGMRAVSSIDRQIFDALTQRIVRGLLTFVRLGNRFDLTVLDAAVSHIGEDLLQVGQRIRRWQSGRIEQYLLVAFVWGVGVLALAVFLSFVR